MIECPQCNSNISGTKCGCGYVVKQKKWDGYDNREQIDVNKWKLEHLNACRQWLLDKGIVSREDTTPERMKKLAAYRNSLIHSDKPDGLDWAKNIVQQIADGIPVLQLQKRMAMEALGIKDEDYA